MEINELEFFVGVIVKCVPDGVISQLLQKHPLLEDKTYRWNNRAAIIADLEAIHSQDYDSCIEEWKSRPIPDGHKKPPGDVYRALQDAGILPGTPPSGPGTELKKLLAKIGIKSSPTCSCNKRAKTMDENGIEWCEQNVETICDWLAEESAKRKLPFVRLAGKAIINMAIRRAKKGNNK